MSRQILERSQTVGDVIGRAIRIYRLNLKTWVPLLIWPTIVCVLGRVITQGGLAFLPETSDTIVSVALGLATIVGFMIWAVAKWVLLIRQLAFIRLANGFTDSLDDALKFMGKRQWTVLGSTILVFFILTAVLGLWFLELIASALLYKRDSFLAIPSTIGIFFGLFAGTISFSFIYYVWFIIFAGVACETRGLTTMVSRGFKLAGKSIFRTLGLGTLICITAYFISFPLWIPPFILIGLDALRIGADLNLASNDMPIHWQVLSSAWEPLVEMIISPITFLAYGFFYYDLRLRQEAVDVSLHINLYENEQQ